MSDGRLPPRRRWVGWVIGLTLLVVILATGWVFFRGFGAASELQNVRNSVGQLQSAIEDRDFARAEQIAPRTEQHAAAAHDLTSDPVWRSFEFIPWLGGGFTSFREIAEITDDVATNAITPLITVARQADLATLGLSGSHVDLAPLSVLQDPLGESATTLAAADLRAQRVDTNVTISMMGDVITQQRDLIHDASRTVGAMHGASVLLPNMLGSNGPRAYLVAVQNNAELRSHGGAVQALALMHADNGALSIDRIVSAHDFPALDAPLPLDEATVALYGDAPGRLVRDATSIPAFAEAGAMLATRWQQQYGDAIDGVIAVDLVTLQQLTAATEQISFGDFTAGADTLVEVLASEVPATGADPAAYDTLVAQATIALASALLMSDDPPAILGALSDAAASGHIRLWSVHPEEQAALAASTLGGALPSDAENDVYVEVLLNDRTGGAMDYYADAAITRAIGECHGDQTTQVHVTWTNDAPASELPASVTGSDPENPDDLEPGTTRTLIAIVGPEGATAKETGDAQAQIGERPVVQYDVTAPRGESVTITATFTGSNTGEQFAHVRHTPMLNRVDVTRAALECE
ncbi:DUF4012 domain-containing protein [Microbacterium sp.]|uniref:DUF4012 domain-containing protein n=1 Tax=Microbacterium sp. TaxID=51671 RepID=UPI003A95513E